MDVRTLLLLIAGLTAVSCDILNIGCLDSTWPMQCSSNQWVEISSVEPDLGCGTSCSEAKRDETYDLLLARCREKNSCSLSVADLGGKDKKCAAKVIFRCVEGKRTTPRVPDTTPRSEAAWHTDYASWQWAIIWIIIGVVVVALIILIVMLINRCCFKALNQEKPKFVEATPTQSNMGSNLNSRSVSMSTLHRPPPVKKEVSQEEIDEVRAHFGTNKKKKDKDKYFGQGVGSLDSRGSGEEPNGKYIMGDDSSSGIGSSTYEGRLKNPMYDYSDTCHDDIVTFTMKKQAKSPLVNPNAYNTLNTPKKVDEEMYRSEAPTVDIHEDKREENFRLDINSWDINVHQRPQQPKQSQQSETQPPPQTEIQPLQNNAQITQNETEATQSDTEAAQSETDSTKEPRIQHPTEEERQNSTEQPNPESATEKIENSQPQVDNEKCNGHTPVSNNIDVDIEASIRL